MCVWTVVQADPVLSLQENNIGDEGAAGVAGALKVNTTLTAL